VCCIFTVILSFVLYVRFYRTHCDVYNRINRINQIKYTHNVIGEKRKMAIAGYTTSYDIVAEKGVTKKIFLRGRGRIRVRAGEEEYTYRVHKRRVRRGLEALLLYCIIIKYIIFDRGTCLARRFPRASAAGAPFIFFGHVRNRSSRENYARPSRHPVYVYVHTYIHARIRPARDRRHGPPFLAHYTARARGTSVRSTEPPVHDDHVTDHSRRLRRIRQGEWCTRLIIIISVVSGARVKRFEIVEFCKTNIRNREKHRFS